MYLIEYPFQLWKDVKQLVSMNSCAVRWTRKMSYNYIIISSFDLVWIIFKKCQTPLLLRNLDVSVKRAAYTVQQGIPYMTLRGRNYLKSSINSCGVHYLQLRVRSQRISSKIPSLRHMCTFSIQYAAVFAIHHMCHTTTDHRSYWTTLFLFFKPFEQ